MATLLMLSACSTGSGGDPPPWSAGLQTGNPTGGAGTPPADTGDGARATTGGTGFNEGEAEGGGESPLGGPGTSSDEQTEWSIVPLGLGQEHRRASAGRRKRHRNGVGDYLYNIHIAECCGESSEQDSDDYRYNEYGKEVEVASMSFGDKLIVTKPPRLPMFTFISHYILCVCSTGNDNSASLNQFPARHSQAFSVAAYRLTGERWVSTLSDGSNYAPDTDIAAPGYGIYTCDMVGKNSDNVDLGSSINAWRTDFRGTSAAAPHVAAIVLPVSAKFDLLDPGSVKGQILETQVGDGPGEPGLSGFGGLITKHPSALHALGLQ